MGKEIKFSQVLVTPALAREWLGKRSRNWRLLDKRAAIQLADAIRRNGWRQDGNSIKFDGDGYLIDGQTRLEAICILGISVPCQIAINVDPFSIDTGRQRTVVQGARARGIKYYAVWASASRLLWEFERGELGRPRYAPTNGELEQRYSTDKFLLEACEMAGQWRGVGFAAHLVFIIAAVSPTAPQLAKAFSHAIQSGADLVDGSPILAFRDRMIKDKGALAKLNARTKLAMMIMCWNKWLRNQPTKILRIGAQDEWPQIIIPERDEQRDDAPLRLFGGR